MQNILIQGIENLLGTYFAARCLQNPDHRIFYLLEATEIEKEVTESVARAFLHIQEAEGKAGNPLAIANRLHWAGRDLDCAAPERILSGIDEIWYFTNSRPGGSCTKILSSLISACRPVGAKEFNYVACDMGGIRLAQEIGEEEIRRRCKAENIGYRFFRTSLIVGDGHPALDGGSAFSQFLSTVYTLKAEIEERSSDYFDFQALRCFAPPDAALNLVPAVTASDLLFRIVRTNGTLDSAFTIVAPESTPFSDVCERISIAYGTSLLAVDDFNALNAIDRVFHERSGDFHGYLIAGPTETPQTQSYQIAGFPVDSASYDEDAQITLFETIRQSQNQALAAARQRAAELPDRLERKTIKRNGSDLRYYICGNTGPVVILLNALGQGLECWYRLMDRLAESCRVIIWEPRGTVYPAQPFGIGDQVDDLDAVVQHEAIESCHLVGWCTGPKVAVEFYLRRPSIVSSMAFLNGTFKCNGSPEEFDSSYEHNLETLCRMLVRKPSMAASVMKTFQSRAEDEIDLPQGSNAEEISLSVLSRINADLKSHVLAPFRNEETTTNYAHQLLDFWSHDVRPMAGEVKVPVLLMGAEHDQVATPASSQMGAGLFANARHVHVNAATHYCMYDQPAFVAGLLTAFFANPDQLPVARPVQDEVTQSQ